jgi:beta-lactamase family protein
MTGTAVMRLVADGRLPLDRPIVEYVPWFRLSDPAATGLVTLRMLLSHTTGLPHDHKPYGPRDAAALERRVREELPRYPLVAAPGTTWSYANTGIHVAAFLAEIRPLGEADEAATAFFVCARELWHLALHVGNGRRWGYGWNAFNDRYLDHKMGFLRKWARRHLGVRAD